MHSCQGRDCLSLHNGGAVPPGTIVKTPFKKFYPIVYPTRPFKYCITQAVLSFLSRRLCRNIRNHHQTRHAGPVSQYGVNSSRHPDFVSVRTGSHEQILDSPNVAAPREGRDTGQAYHARNDRR